MRRWVLVLVPLLLLAGAHAEEHAFTVRVRLPDGTPAVTGKVELISIYPEDGLRLLRGRWNPRCAPVKTHATAPIDAKGGARFPDLPPGAWLVLARVPGFAPATAEVRWASGMPVPTVDLAVAPAAKLEGVVRNTRGNPLGGVEIAVSRTKGRLGPERPIHNRILRTAADGSYRFEDLPPGPYLTWTRRAGTGWMRARAGYLSLPAASRLDLALLDGARIYGAVTDAATGKPVAGATVRLDGDEFSPRRRLAATRTDASGRYVLLTQRDHVNAGGMTVEADGYRRASLRHTDFWNLPDGKVLKRDFRLRPTGAPRRESRPKPRPKPRPRPKVTITGTVRDDAGEPIPLADVLAESGEATVTDARGRFRLLATKPRDDYSLTFEARREGYGPREAWLSHDTPEDTTGVEIVLERCPVLLGRVLSRDGKPVPGAVVRIAQHWKDKGQNHHAWWGIARGAVTEPDGTYRLFLPTPRILERSSPGFGDIHINELIVCAIAPGHGPAFSKPFPMKEGVPEVRVDLRLTESRVATGRVVEDATGEPVAGVPISVSNLVRQRRPAGWPPRYPPAPWGSVMAVTDAEGRWRVADLPVARFTVSVDVSGFAYERAETELAKPVELRLRRLEPLAGVVVDAEGKPIEGVTVWDEDEWGKIRHHAGTGTRPKTDAKGRFRFERLRAGLYRVHAHLEDEGPRLSLPGKPRAAGSNLAPACSGLVKSGRTDLRLVLRPGGTIEGRLLDPEGEPLAESSVSVRSEEGEEGPAGYLDTDADGRFRFVRIGAGPHVVSFGDVDVRLRGVKAGAKLEVRVPGTLTVEGRVLVPEGYRVSGLDLRAVPLDRPARCIHYTWTKRRETFRFLSLAPGRYRIEGEGDGGGHTRYRVGPVVVEAGATGVEVPLEVVSEGR
jgi:protocatechuate 3,4-dioxygenase beta subunit